MKRCEFGFKIANITENAIIDDSSDPDDGVDESSDALTDKQFLKLFDSDSENSDFYGFKDF